MMELPDCHLCNHRVVCRWLYDYGEAFREMADSCPFYESKEDVEQKENKVKKTRGQKR
jgi:hypothetical protein